jgi:hypothetical protein
MTDATQAMRDDIAFMKALVEDGGRPSGGRTGLMISAGLIYAAASFYSWSVAAGMVRGPGAEASAGWVWLAASILFLGVLAVAKLRQPRTALVGAKAARAAWTGMGYAIWTLCLGISLIGWRTHDALVFSLIPPIVLALYAGGWMVAGAVVGAAWPRWLGYTALLTSLGLAALAGEAVQLLAFGFAILAFTALPGAFVMLRAQARTDGRV